MVPGEGDPRLLLPLTISVALDGASWAVWARNLELGISMDFAVTAENEDQALGVATDILRRAVVTVQRAEADPQFNQTGQVDLNDDE